MQGLLPIGIDDIMYHYYQGSIGKIIGCDGCSNYLCPCHFIVSDYSITILFNLLYHYCKL